MSIHDDQVALENAANAYRLTAVRPTDNVIRVLRLFDAGLMTPGHTRALLLDVAQQAIDEAEGFRTIIAELTESWRLMNGWQDSDTVTTTGLYQPVAD